jgi:hypothetical protein
MINPKLRVDPTPIVTFPNIDMGLTTTIQPIPSFIYIHIKPRAMTIAHLAKADTQTANRGSAPWPSVLVFWGLHLPEKTPSKPDVFSISVNQ